MGIIKSVVSRFGMNCFMQTFSVPICLKGFFLLAKLPRSEHAETKSKLSFLPSWDGIHVSIVDHYFLNNVSVCEYLKIAISMPVKILEM